MKNFLYLIRVLFPSWNFFDQTGYAFKLYFRNQIEHPWEKFEFSGKLSPLSLFSNPQINELLAQAGLIEQLAYEAQHPSYEHIQDSAPYKMICSLIQNNLQQRQIVFSKTQFKIETIDGGKPVEIYTSDWIYS